MLNRYQSWGAPTGLLLVAVCGCTRLNVAERSFSTFPAPGGKSGFGSGLGASIFAPKLRLTGVMQNQILGFFIVTTIALGVLCGVQWQRAEKIRRQSASLREELAQESLKTATQEAALNKLERERHRLDLAAYAATAQVRELTAVSNQLARALSHLNRNSLSLLAANPLPDGQGILARLLEDASVQERLRSLRQARLEMLFQGLFQKGGLNEDENARLREWLLERDLLEIKHGAASLLADSDAARQALRQSAEARTALDAKIKELLGEKRFARYRDYVASERDRLWLEQFRAELSGTTHPLEETQSAQLLQILFEENLEPSEPAPAESPARSWLKRDRNEIIQAALELQKKTDRRVLVEAEAVLSPEQCGVFAAFQTNRLNRLQSRLEAARDQADDWQVGREIVIPEPLPVPTANN